tara:strand:- start:775 stop:2694 length:1920 start_codon:yes stop_codon:yes gene_type:complete
MIGAGSGAGGLGVAGGSLTGRTPFINPEDVARRNVGAGQRLSEQLGRTFTDPASQISGRIGEEQRGFEEAAKKQKLDFGASPLGGQVAKTPMSIGGSYDPESKSFQGDLGELQRRLALQYSGPQEFKASTEVTDPLAKFQDRLKAYGVTTPGTGIEREGVRQSLIGEIMQPTSTGGKRSLEEYLLTSNPAAMQSLKDTIAQTGRQGPVTEFGGTQATPAPIARLERARKELAALVKSRQDLAEKTREEARRDIGLGMGEIESGVSGDITQALADAKRREEMITGGYVSPEERGEEFSVYDQLPELFRGEYTDEEKQLAERLGLRTLDEETGEYTDQASMAQDQLQRLLDPYNKEYGFLNPEEFQGDEVTGVDYRNLDPLSSLFTTINPETVYTPEQMIGEQESSRLAELQQLIGPEGSAPITRAEGALGGAGRTIEAGNVQDWLDQMAGFQEEKQQRAEDIRKSRMVEEIQTELPQAPQTGGGFQPQDQELTLDYINQLETRAQEINDLNNRIGEHDALDEMNAQIDQDMINGTISEEEARMRRTENDDLRKRQGPRPSPLDELKSLLAGDEAANKIAKARETLNLQKAQYEQSRVVPPSGSSGIVGGTTPGTRYYGGAPVVQAPQSRYYGGQSAEDDY